MPLQGVRPFVINAFSYLGMLATLVWWKPARSRSTLPPEPLGTAIAAGIRYVSLSPHLLAILPRCLLYIPTRRCRR